MSEVVIASAGVSGSSIALRLAGHGTANSPARTGGAVTSIIRSVS